MENNANQDSLQILQMDFSKMHHLYSPKKETKDIDVHMNNYVANRFELKYILCKIHKIKQQIS